MVRRQYDIRYCPKVSVGIWYEPDDIGLEKSLEKN